MWLLELWRTTNSTVYLKPDPEKQMYAAEGTTEQQWKFEVTRRTNGGSTAIEVHGNLAGQAWARQPGRGWGGRGVALHPALGDNGKALTRTCYLERLDCEHSSPVSGFHQLEGFYLWISLSDHNKGSCRGRRPCGDFSFCNRFPIGKILGPDSLWKLCFYSLKSQHLCFQSISGVFLILSWSYWTASLL